MKPILLGAITTLAALSTALAAPACLSGPVAITSSTVVECGGLTFSDFSIAGDLDTRIELVNAETDEDQVDLMFTARDHDRHENLHFDGPDSLFLYFTVAGLPIDWVQLIVASKRVAIHTDACGASGGESCTADVLTQLASSSGSPWKGRVRDSQSISPTAPLRIQDAIEFDGRGRGEAVFSNSFQTVVAEPVTAGTIGFGLLLVGWAYRRTRRPQAKK